MLSRGISAPTVNAPIPTPTFSLSRHSFSTTSTSTATKHLHPEPHPDTHLHPHPPKVARLPPVDLAHKYFKSPIPGGSTKAPLILTHGYLCSSKNWLEHAEHFRRSTGRDVFLIDLPNHGDSPYNYPMNFGHIANDMEHFMRKHDLLHAKHVAHSIGGKVVMQMLLQDHTLLNKVVIVDTAPVVYQFNKGMRAKLLQLVAIPQTDTKEEASKLIDQVAGGDPLLARTFIENLEKCNTTNKWKLKYDFKGLLDTLDDFLLHEFPNPTIRPVSPFTGNVGDRFMLIRALNSKFVGDRELERYKQLFPGYAYKEFQSSHLLFIDPKVYQPFMKTIEDFLGDD